MGFPWKYSQRLLFRLVYFTVLVASTVPCVTCQQKICIVGSGVGGSSTAFFLRNRLPNASVSEIHVFEKGTRVGGRVASIKIGGDVFESGASIIHSQNIHMVNFAKSLGLKQKQATDLQLGLWDGNKFVYREVSFGKNWILSALGSWINTCQLITRYGIFDLYNIYASIKVLLARWLKLYEPGGARPFQHPEDMLRSVGLFNVTQCQLADYFRTRGLSARSLDELVTMVMRVQYGQDTGITALAGMVALCGTGGSLWAVQGGNKQIPEGLLKLANASVHLNHSVSIVTQNSDQGYSLELLGGQSFQCDAVFLAAPLEEGGPMLQPAVTVPKRTYQITFATFVRGALNYTYFGQSKETMPSEVLTMESPDIPFLSLSLQRQYGPQDATYKFFSRQALSKDLLDSMFIRRNATKSIKWAAYPHYTPPEHFAPFLLDDRHLYYISGFESAASAMEAAAVAADNVVDLFMSRWIAQNIRTEVENIKLQQEL